MSVPAASSSRYDFLDWLRVIAIFVLLFYHTGMMFVGWSWHIQNAETIDWLQRPMDIAHRLRMPLLFVIAGAGMWFAAQRRTGMELLRERSMRLLVPVVAGMLLIVPPQIYFERVAHGDWHGGYIDFYFQRVLEFVPYPKGNFSWHHLWFVVYLYAYVLLLLPLLLWWRSRGTRVRPGAWIYLLAVPLGINEALLKPVFPEAHNLVSDWYLFNHYLLLTIYGFALASVDGVWDWIAARRRSMAAASLSVLTIGLMLFSFGIVARDTAFDSIFANVFTWITLLAFIGYGRTHLSFENSLIRWARDASYPIYILHQTIIIAIGYYVIQQPWSPGMKYWLVVIGTLAVCVTLYEFLVRRFAVTRLMFGMRTVSKKTSERPPGVQVAMES